MELQEGNACYLHVFDNSLMQVTVILTGITSCCFLVLVCLLSEKESY